LWKVEDKATSLLMVKLYQEILNGEKISEALRRAKLSFIGNPFTAFPKYWAGFILLGG
jgi:CHAT domain-containing protein